MKKGEWLFEYSAKDLAQAATKKMNHHNDRAEWWKMKKVEVMNEVKESGIEVSESVASEYSNYTSTNRGNGPQVMVRTDLQNKLTEIHSKILSHEQKTKEYHGWEQVLSSAAKTDRRLELNADDYLYFFGV